MHEWLQTNLTVQKNIELSKKSFAEEVLGFRNDFINLIFR